MVLLCQFRDHELPEKCCESFIQEGATIPLADKPFDLKVVKYHKNSRLRDKKDMPPGETNLATLGLGRDLFVEPLKPVSGVDTGKNSDMTSAYVELIDKAGKSLEAIKEEVRSSLAKDPDALEDVTLPRDQRENARQYFERLRKGE